MLLSSFISLWLLIFVSISHFLCLLPKLMLLQNVNVKKKREGGEKVKVGILALGLFQLSVHEETDMRQKSLIKGSSCGNRKQELMIIADIY